MSRLLNLFRQSFVNAAKETPSSIARDRLSVMLVHQRHLQQLSDVDMEALQKELTVVVQKYVKVGGAEPVNYSGKINQVLIFLLLFFFFSIRRFDILMYSPLMYCSKT